MNNKLIRVLLVACVPLLLLVVAEWFYALQVRQSALAPDQSANKSGKAVEMPVLELGEPGEESYQAMVNRPLFVKGRKPIDEPNALPGQADAVQANFDWRLDGVYASPKGKSALFSRVTLKIPKDNYRRIALDGNLDGWKLAQIHPDKVVLVLGDSEKELPLRKPKPKTPNELKPRPGQPPTSGQAVPHPPGAPPVPQPDPETEPEEDSTEDLETNAPND